MNSFKTRLTRMVALSFLLAVSLFGPNVALANLVNTCNNTTVNGGTDDPSVPWFTLGSTVDLWYTTDSSLSPLTATTLPVAQFQAAIIKAVNVWNEQSGSYLRIRYRGPTSSDSISCDQSFGQQCGIVIQGNLTYCTPVDVTEAYVTLDTLHKFQTGIIVIYEKDSNCNQAPWSTTTSGGLYDVVARMIHEMGHEFFAMGHPNEASGDCTQYDPYGNVLESVMWTNHDSRNLKAWDQEVAQERYGSRATHSKMMKTHVSGATAWQTPVQVTGSTGQHSLFRPHSMTSEINTRVVSWIDGGTAYQEGGAGSVFGARYADGLSHVATLASRVVGTTPGAIGRPVAVASQSYVNTTPVVLVVYQKTQTGYETYDRDVDNICWKTSSDLGVTYSAESCSSIGTTIHGVSAAYDFSANKFVIAYTHFDRVLNINSE